MQKPELREDLVGLWWENFITSKVTESEWKDNFRMSRKSFYELCHMLRPYLGKKCTRFKTPVSVEAQVGLPPLPQVGSFLYYLSNKGRYRKTANAFGISKASISGIIKRISYAVTVFVVPN